MVIHYTEEGNIRIELVTIEDRIIWKYLFNSRLQAVVFERTGCGEVYEAVPPSSDEDADDNSRNVVLMTLDERISYRELQRYKADEAKIGAVKYVKDVTGWGLKESKNYIDERWDNITPAY